MTLSKIQNILTEAMSTILKNYNYKPIENYGDSILESSENITIKNQSNVYKKLSLLTAVTCLVILLILYNHSFYYNVIKYQVFITPNTTRMIMKKTNVEGPLTNLNGSQMIEKRFKKERGIKYLVSTSKCKILNLDPFSKEAMKFVRHMNYKNCSEHQLLTHVTKTNNFATVHVDMKILASYTKKEISCCYSNITRHSPFHRPDDYINTSDCRIFRNQVNITEDAILIRCSEMCIKNCTKKEKIGKTIYENVHTAIRIDKRVQDKIDKWKNDTEKPMNILMIGIDSVSRLNIFRKMKKTSGYIKKNKWLTLEGYNKMADNTFPNLLGALGGLKLEQGYKICKPSSVGGMDKCPLIWYTFRNSGYITAYAEDDPYISTFNYLKKGFKKPPTDFYFRPYVIATEKLLKSKWLDGTKYCTGPETAGERIMNLAKEFASTFKNTPSFGLFWMNSFSHNALNTPQVMDDKVQQFLIDLENGGVYNNSLVIFFSDHGMRFGGIRSTETGWLEAMLPFIFLSFPPWFKGKFPKEYQNFLNNKNQLSTPYDLYMTLQHLLVLSRINYTVSSSRGCPKCVSLFEKISSERSCEDLSIPESYCTCKGYLKTNLNPNIARKISVFLRNEFNKIILKFKEGRLCAKYQIKELSKTKLSQEFPLNISSNQTYSFLRVDFETAPKAKFGTILTIFGNISLGNYSMGSISRLDKYGSHSRCVKDGQLKVYCYCL